MEAHAILEASERTAFGWRLMIAYLAFGRDDVAIGIVNDVLDDTDRRKPADRARALDCLSVLLLFLAGDPAARDELSPYIAEFARLAHSVAEKQSDNSLRLLATYLLSPAFQLPIDEQSRQRLRDIVDPPSGEPEDRRTAVPLRLAELATASSGHLPREILATVESFTTAFVEPDAASMSEALVTRREAQLRTLEAWARESGGESRTKHELAGILADLNARQLRALLRSGDIDGAMRRAFRRFREPRTPRLMADSVEGATLFLRLARARFNDDTVSSPAFYNSQPVRLIRRHFAERLLPGPLDNQLLPFLARNLDIVAPLAAELLMLYSRRPETYDSAVVLILVLGELIFDRMAWKVQDLARTNRRVLEETTVLLSEYEKVVFNRGQRAGRAGTAGRPRSVPHHRLRMRISDSVGQPHRFAPRLILNELRRNMGPRECLVSFRLDANGLWMGLVQTARGPVVRRLCNNSPAASAIAAYREDSKTGAIALWNETDFAWFGDTIVAPLESLLPPEVERLVVVGSQLDLPLHAAYVSGAGYAIERYCIMYEQSRRSLAANRARQHEAVTRLALIAHEGVGQRRLRYLQSEVAHITTAARGRLCRPRPSTSRRSARALLRDGSIDAVHMSGHMRDPVDVAGWRLQLRDGELECLSALRPLAAQLRLVVLMACSAGATMPRGLSLEAGLPHALVALGAGAVVAPRRPIDDRIAAAFSESFYAHLAVSADIPQAYRRSLVRVIAEHRPGAWSALALHGR